jgi:uncharacterized protein YqjF (DUF2071 family)
MRVFLTADWKHLLMLNYAVEPDLLRPHVPNGVELDTWNGVHYVSMVGFLFLETKVLGMTLPGHRDFEEVNLRFYVRRRAPDGWRRGVVFIKEIVPRPLIAAVARTCYNEPYAAMPMRHSVDTENGALRAGGSVEYAWRYQSHWNKLRANVIGPPQLPGEDSEATFITEHHWGYTAQASGACKEYRVEHPRWTVHQAGSPTFECDIAALYGPKFVAALSAPPVSAFIATGSPVTVSSGSAIQT